MIMTALPSTGCTECEGLTCVFPQQLSQRLLQELTTVLGPAPVLSAHQQLMCAQYSLQVAEKAMLARQPMLPQSLTRLPACCIACFCRCEWLTCDATSEADAQGTLYKCLTCTGAEPDNMEWRAEHLCLPLAALCQRARVLDLDSTASSPL